MTLSGARLLTYKPNNSRKRDSLLVAKFYKGIGDVDISYLGCLKNVHDASHSKAHLITSQRLVKELSFPFLLDSDGCFLYGKVMGQRTGHV